MRLGVYSDLAYRRDGDTYSTHQAFIRLIVELSGAVDEVVLFGRVDPTPGVSHYVLPRERLRFVELPHYPSVKHLVGQARAMRLTAAVFADECSNLDAVWIFGPHPMALVLAFVARRRGTPLFLGVRQDYPEYIRHRLPNRLWTWSVGVAYVLELAFRWLARDAPTVVLGDELARKYRAAGATRVLSTGFSLVSAHDIVDVHEAIAQPWTRPYRVLSVGRLDAEKNPLLLIEVAAELCRRDSGWRFVIAGDGPLREALQRRAAELGVSDRIELVGYVPSGPELFELYRRSDVFLHVSLTEGVPQVIWEAQAAGIPVVATDVGGVREGLGPGCGILLQPNDVDGAVRALERLRDDDALRKELVLAGSCHVREQTSDAQIRRILNFFHDTE